MTLKDRAGSLADGTVVLVVTMPDSSVVSPVVSRLSLGLYSADVSLSQVGVYSYQWSVTGAAEAGSSGSLMVR